MGHNVVIHYVFSGNDCCNVDNRNHVILCFCIESFEDSVAFRMGFKIFSIIFRIFPMMANVSFKFSSQEMLPYPSHAQQLK